GLVAAVGRLQRLREERQALGDDVALLLCLVAVVLRSEEHTSELQSLRHLVCRLLLEKKKKKYITSIALATQNQRITYLSLLLFVTTTSPVMHPDDALINVAISSLYSPSA